MSAVCSFPPLLYTLFDSLLLGWRRRLLRDPTSLCPLYPILLYPPLFRSLQNRLVTQDFGKTVKKKDNPFSLPHLLENWLFLIWSEVLPTEVIFFSHVIISSVEVGGDGQEEKRNCVCGMLSSFFLQRKDRLCFCGFRSLSMTLWVLQEFELVGSYQNHFSGFLWFPG